MRAGRLNKRVTLQRRASGEDDFGQPVETWNPIATRWASIRPLAGREYFAAHGQNSAVNTEIRIRYDNTVAGLVAADRVLFGSTVYDIESVINPNQSNDELVIMAVLHG